MVELGDWAIDRAMKDLRDWNNAGYQLKLAVNVSPVQLRSMKLVETLKAGAMKYGITPDTFEIEITEEAIFDQGGIAEQVLREISALGFKISIDDFGTGYSNLSRLTALPIDILKIDKSLIRNAVQSRKVESVLESTITLARNLECFVVAEGIETFELAEFATEKGANQLQGFLFSESLPSREFQRWVDSADWTAVGQYAALLDQKAA